MAELFNPERTWERPEQTIAIDGDEIARRIGAVGEPWEVLGGGQANINIGVGGRVLRIYRRDPSAAAMEATLLELPWRSFRVPELLARGDDFVVLARVPHRPLEDRPEHGAAAGRALAEIHGRAFTACSFFLDRDLTAVEPLEDFVAAWAAYARAELAGTPWEQLGAAAAQTIERRAVAAALGQPVLLHGDFKPSNLHWTEDGQLLVLDWEFAYAGPRLMDVAQLARWDPPAPFIDAFAASYRAAGGALDEDWRRWTAVLDLGNLAGLLARARPGSRRARDVCARIEEILDGVATDRST
jgi:aminoglycoside phosphotransferase (APT) family kinase protein